MSSEVSVAPAVAMLMNGPATVVETVAELLAELISACAAVAVAVEAKFPLTEDKQTGFEWPELVAHWHAWLAKLAEDFASGSAEVNPKLAADSCRRCHLGALCRVEAASLVDADEEDTDGE